MTATRQLPIDPLAVVSTDRLRLESVNPAHALSLFMPLRADRLYRFLSELPPMSVGELRRQFELWSSRPDRGLCYVVTSMENGSAVGMVRTSYVGDGRALVWCKTFSHSVGRRYSREAVRALRDLLVGADFAVEAHVDTRNSSAQQLFEALGFRAKMVIENADYVRGAPSDDIVYVYWPSGGQIVDQ